MMIAHCGAPVAQKRAARYQQEITDQRLLTFRTQGDLVTDGLEYPHVPGVVAFGDHIANQILGIALRLEAHNVVLHEQRDEVLMVRQRGQHLRWGKRNVQEKSDPVAVPTAAQRVRNGDQVVVMDPDQIIVIDDFLELGREMFIDPGISAEIPAREFGQSSR